MTSDQNIQEGFDSAIKKVCISYHRLKTAESMGLPLDSLKKNHMKLYQAAISFIPQFPDAELPMRLLAEYRV